MSNGIDKILPGLIILAGGSIAHKLPFLTDASKHPALIPVGLKSTFGHHLEFYKDCVREVILVTQPGYSECLYREFNSIVFSDAPAFRIIEAQTSSIVESLHLALEGVRSDIDDWVVTPITTIPNKLPAKKSLLFEQGIRKSAGWSILKKSKKLPIFLSRSDVEGELGHAFMGVIRGSLQDLKDLSVTCNSSDLIELAEKLYTQKRYSAEFCEWIDVGHAANYYLAKSKLISSRHFNNIEIDVKRGILNKSSINFEKIQNEQNFIEALPRDLAVWFPRQLNQKPPSETQNGSISMEYYSYPSVAELALYWRVDVVQWELLFQVIKVILNSFEKYPQKISLVEYEDFYITKTEKRLRDFYLQNPDYFDIFSQPIQVNGEWLQPFEKLWPLIKEKIKDFYSLNSLCIMHGDLCFNNILFDPYGGTVRLIDPRGSFASSRVCVGGDAKYDLAKLSHSAIYGYDYLVAGHYEIYYELNKRIFNYKIIYNQNHAVLKKECEQLIKDLGFQIFEIELITALLFISMTSLHYENKQRQLAMYLHGLYLMNNYVNNL